jgi:outer membrane lipoprotein-sorting protein
MSDQRLDMPAPQGPNGRGDLLVDRAAAALRQARVPDGPPADVLDRTLRALGVAAVVEATPAEPVAPALGAPRMTLHPNNSERSAIPMKRLLRYAAAAAIAVVAAGLVLWAALQYGSRPVMADVLRQIRDVKAVTFKVTTKINVPGAPPQEVTADVLLTESGQMRQTTAQPAETITVMDMHQGKALTLIPSQKQAVIIELANMDPSQLPPNALEDLKKLDPKDATPVGEKEINGRMFSGFKAKKDGQDMTIWVDPGTRLPVRMELTMNTPVMPAVEVVMTDFVWNAKLDPSQLSLTAPPDYKVMPLHMNMAPAAEKDLTESLHAIAGLNGGVFPNSMDLDGLAGVMKGVKDRLPAGAGEDAPDARAFQEKASQAMLTVGRAWMFMGDAKNGSDFRYAGKGVKFGTKGRAVLWYKPKGSEAYRVIDADLSVRDVPANELPDVPSQRVETPGNAATAPATK